MRAPILPADDHAFVGGDTLVTRKDKLNTINYLRWLPLLDKYRTMCLTPTESFSHLLAQALAFHFGLLNVGESKLQDIPKQWMWASCAKVSCS
jgi:hypothetical protein